MKMSVAMCSYQGEPFIAEQIASIVGQTVPPDEIIVCDDRSDDSTAALVERIAAASAVPIRLTVNDERLGSNRNFERAISLCSGDIIFLSDQDDVWMPNKVEAFRAAFAADPPLLALFSDAQVVDAALGDLGYGMLDHVGIGAAERARLARDDAFDLVVARQFVTGATLAFRSSLKSLILPIPPGSRLMIHDRWIGIAAAAVGKLGLIDRKLIQYRQHDRQQMGAPVIHESAADKLATIRESGPASYAPYLAFLRALRDEVTSRAGERVRPEFLEALDSMIRHLAERCHLPARRFQRIRTVVGELAAGRYSRFSNGWLSAIKDVGRA